LGRFFYLQSSSTSTTTPRPRTTAFRSCRFSQPRAHPRPQRRGARRNYSAYTLELTFSKIADLEGTIDELATIVDIQPRDRRRFQRLRDESKGRDTLPIRTRLTDEEVAKLAVNRYRFPGMDIKGRLFRQYPLGEVASHVVGYISRIDDRDLERIEESDQSAITKAPTTSGKRAWSSATSARFTARPASNRWRPTREDASCPAAAAHSSRRARLRAGNNLALTSTFACRSR